MSAGAWVLVVAVVAAVGFGDSIVPDVEEFTAKLEEAAAECTQLAAS